MPLLTLRDAIATAWEGLAPPAYGPPGADPRKYRHVEVLAAGASSHRSFVFEDAKGGAPRSQDATRYGVDHEFMARVSLHVPERSTTEFDAAYREYQTLAKAVKSIKIARVANPKVIEWHTEKSSDDEQGLVFDLVMTIVCRTREQSV